MSPPLIRDEGDILLFTLDDPAALNEGQASGLRQALYDAVEARAEPLVAIDLGTIDYISSTGIALMIGLKRRVEARRGGLALFGLRGEVLELFAVMRLASLFVIVVDREGAFKALRSGAAE